MILFLKELNAISHSKLVFDNDPIVHKIYTRIARISIDFNWSLFLNIFCDLRRYLNQESSLGL